VSAVVDVGDAVELTFNTAPNASVVASWLDPDQTAVFEAVLVDENPDASGKFPYTFLPTRPGVWTAVFTASNTAVAVERYYVRATDPDGPPPLAAVGDVASQFGDLTPAQEGITSWLLRAASKMVRARFPLVDAHLAAGKLDPDVVALAVANMVLRVLRNPGGLRSETVGPFSRTYDTTVAAGLLAISTQEIAMFTPIPDPLAIPVGTIRVRVGLPGPCGGPGGWGW
jgi:hypothetical protein